MEAIRATFRNRGTAVNANPEGLTQAYSSDPARVMQWRAFVHRSRLDARWELENLAEQVQRFA